MSPPLRGESPVAELMRIPSMPFSESKIYASVGACNLLFNVCFFFFFFVMHVSAISMTYWYLVRAQFGLLVGKHLCSYSPVSNFTSTSSQLSNCWSLHFCCKNAPTYPQTGKSLLLGVSLPFTQSNIVPLLVAIKLCIFLKWLMLLNLSIYGDIYKREKCLLVASVHDLWAGAKGSARPKCCLMPFSSLLNQGLSRWNPSWCVQTSQSGFLLIRPNEIY